MKTKHVHVVYTINIYSYLFVPAEGADSVIFLVYTVNVRKAGDYQALEL